MDTSPLPPGNHYATFEESTGWTEERASITRGTMPKGGGRLVIYMGWGNKDLSGRWDLAFGKKVVE